MAYRNANNTGLTRIEFLVILLIIAAMLALILPAILNAHEAASESACLGRMAGLKHALRRFEQTRGHFPPATFVSEDGKAQHSWRVLILPYLADSNVIDEYRFNENWDSPHNSTLTNGDLAEIFQCPSRAYRDKENSTDYVVVRGESTAFPNDKTVQVSDLKDGPENTALIVESHGLGIHWSEPRDMNFETMSFEINEAGKPCINSPHPVGPGMVFADIDYYRLGGTITGSDVKAFLTIAAGDSPKRDELDRGSMVLGR
jgi:competence protein ComGC